MPNPIKYTTGTESQALKKGNFYIGTGDVGKGPTNVTGYYNGITPPSGGYAIYLNKASGGPSIYTASNDAQLISLTNTIAGASYTTVNECLVYFAGQTDKVCVNRDYEGIVTDGLVLNLDAGFTPSYPKNGTTWYDTNSTVSTRNCNLINGPTYSTDGGGSILFDGTNDYGDIPYPSNNSTSMSICIWTYLVSRRNYGGFLDSYQDQWEFITDSSGQKLSFVLWKSNGGYNEYKSTIDVPVGEWCFVACSINGTSINLYLNTNKYSHTMSETIKTGGNSLKVGASISGAPQYLNGKIAIVQMYNRALSETEVLQNYNAQKGRFGL